MKKKYQQSTDKHTHTVYTLMHSLFLQLERGNNSALAVADHLTNHTAVQITSLFLEPVCKHQMTKLPGL
jgi:O-acetylhomoserine/O-acetylserine sulfhydrylase-like pyridoxal-dependent enzyme